MKYGAMLQKYKIWIMLGMVVVLVVLGYFGYCTWKKKKNASKQNTQQTPNFPPPLPPMPRQQQLPPQQQMPPPQQQQQQQPQQPQWMVAHEDPGNHLSPQTKQAFLFREPPLVSQRPGSQFTDPGQGRMSAADDLMVPTNFDLRGEAHQHPVPPGQGRVGSGSLPQQSPAPLAPRNQQEEGFDPDSSLAKAFSNIDD